MRRFCHSGKRRPARSTMTALTTGNSIKVKADFHSTWSRGKLSVFGFQVVLGGVEFLYQVGKYVTGDGREQRAAVRLAVARPTLSTVIGCVEKLKGESWAQFRDQHGDSGRDVPVYVRGKH